MLRIRKPGKNICGYNACFQSLNRRYQEASSVCRLRHKMFFPINATGALFSASHRCDSSGESKRRITIRTFEDHPCDSALPKPVISEIDDQTKRDVH